MTDAISKVKQIITELHPNAIIQVYKLHHLSMKTYEGFVQKAHKDLHKWFVILYESADPILYITGIGVCDILVLNKDNYYTTRKNAIYKLHELIKQEVNEYCPICCRLSIENIICDRCKKFACSVCTGATNGTCPYCRYYTGCMRIEVPKDFIESLN